MVQPESRATHITSLRRQVAEHPPAPDGLRGCASTALADVPLHRRSCYALWSCRSRQSHLQWSTESDFAAASCTYAGRFEQFGQSARRPEAQNLGHGRLRLFDTTLGVGKAGQRLLGGAPPWGYQPARAAKSSLSAATPRGSLESHDQTDTTGFRVVIWPKSGQTWVLARASRAVGDLSAARTASSKSPSAAGAPRSVPMA